MNKKRILFNGSCVCFESDASNPIRHNRNTLYLTLFLALINFTNGFTGEKADFLVVENIKIFSILDKYEQPLTESAKDRFLPYSPLQIVNADATLGDEITEALKFRYNRKTFFFLKDDNGNLIGDKKHLYSHILKKCTVIGDTIQITKRKAVLLSKQYPSKGRRVYLERNECCIRLFVYKGYHYVKTIGTSAQYGWCSFSSKNGWKIARSVSKKREYNLNSVLKERIVSRIEKANTAYQQYFNHFNSITKQGKSIPQWRYSFDENTFHCTITGPYKNTEQLEESTYYLVQDIENMLLGKAFNVEYQTGEIIITKKE